MNNKLAILCSIATALNNTHAQWALGGSAMLYLRGMVDDFADIDIVISDKCVASVAKCMDALGSRIATQPNSNFCSANFMQYNVGGVGLDIICDFGIVCDGVTYTYDWCDSDTDSNMVIDGVYIPLHSLSVWRQFYLLMGRHDKVQLIDSSMA